MNEHIKAFSIAIVCATVFIGFGYYLHPDTKEVVKYHCPAFYDMDGYVIHESDIKEECPVIPVLKVEKVISVLAEKKECEEKGGEFRVIHTPWNNAEQEISEISCSRTYDEGNKHITEKIFEYEITN